MKKENYLMYAENMELTIYRVHGISTLMFSK